MYVPGAHRHGPLYIETDLRRTVGFRHSGVRHRIEPGSSFVRSFPGKLRPLQVMQPEMESRQQERVALFIFLFCSHRDLPHHLNLYNAARHLLIDESKKITSPDTERTAAPGEDFGTDFWDYFCSTRIATTPIVGASYSDRWIAPLCQRKRYWLEM
jgi:hypothetical protein